MLNPLFQTALGGAGIAGVAICLYFFFIRKMLKNAKANKENPISEQESQRRHQTNQLIILTVFIIVFTCVLGYFVRNGNPDPYPPYALPVKPDSSFKDGNGAQRSGREKN